MERMAKQRQGLHTHIFCSPETKIIARSTAEKLDWIKFFFFYEIGDEYVMGAMPDLEDYWDITNIEKL
jgi:hypothetical protein